MDKGSEYRSLLGLPGGLNHPMYPEVEAAALEAGFKLQPGKGNDPDTLGKQIVYVMDSNEFPFYQAEVYHQVCRRPMAYLEFDLESLLVVIFSVCSHTLAHIPFDDLFISITTTFYPQPTAESITVLSIWLWKMAESRAQVVLIESSRALGFGDAASR
jgi:hypothetical protein